MSRKQLSEQEIRIRYITPAIQAAGWKPQKIREEVTFTAGRIIVTARPSGYGGPDSQNSTAARVSGLKTANSSSVTRWCPRQTTR